MNDKRAARLARRRGRKWAEQLSENSSLRDNLPDEQATVLLEWGLAEIKRAAKQHMELPQEDAEPLIEKEATAVKLIMQGVNDLMGGVGKPLDHDVIDDTMTRMLKNHRWLTERPLTAEQRAARASFEKARQTGENKLAFDSLMTLIQTDTQTE